MQVQKKETTQKPQSHSIPVSGGDTHFCDKQGRWYRALGSEQLRNQGPCRGKEAPRVGSCHESPVNIEAVIAAGRTTESRLMLKKGNVEVITDRFINESMKLRNSDAEVEKNKRKSIC